MKAVERPDLLPLWEVSGEHLEGVPDDLVLTYPIMGNYLLQVVKNYQEGNQETTLEEVLNRAFFSLAASLKLIDNLVVEGEE